MSGALWKMQKPPRAGNDSGQSREPFRSTIRNRHTGRQCGGGRVLALPLRGFYLDLRTKSIRLSQGRSIREKRAKGRQLFP